MLFIVGLGWMYVVLMMAVAEAGAPGGTLLGALLTALLYGIAPLALALYLLATPARRRARHRQAAHRAIQIEADMRPVTRSRRNEKNLEDSSTVHQAPP